MRSGNSSKNNKRIVIANKIWIVVTIFFTALYMMWRLVFTIPKEKGMLSLILGIVLLAVELMGLLEMVVHFYNMYDYDIEKVKRPDLKESDFPEVDIIIPSLNETVELLEKTITGCKKMKYPVKDKVNIYLCDDSNRHEIKTLAEKLSINYLARSTHEDAKAGNLNYALKHSRSPYIVVFDADMIPEQDFLMETIPYFAPNIIKGGKNKVGFVQTPQSFYEPDIFQKNLSAQSFIPNEQDYFYKIVQLSKNKSNSVIFGGSNAVLSRKALEEIGGFVTGVLTEDFATGIEIEKKGYSAIAIDTVLAKGKTPVDFSTFLKQRRRWARGCIQSGRKVSLLRTKELSFVQKLNYLISISYWYSSIKRFVYILSPVLFALFGIVSVEFSLGEVILFWLPMYICCNICMKRFSKGIRTTVWTDLYETVLFPFMLGTVVAESVGLSKKEFEVTDKGDKKGYNFKYVCTFILIELVLICAFLRMCSQTVIKQTGIYVFIIFWIVVSIYNVWMSILSIWNVKAGDNSHTVLSDKLKKSSISICIRGLYKHLI